MVLVFSTGQHPMSSTLRRSLSCLSQINEFPLWSADIPRGVPFYLSLKFLMALTLTTLSFEFFSLRLQIRQYSKP
jgi:hypothetical protein